MPTAFERATAKALGVIKRQTGVSVTYRRGVDEIEVVAIRGTTLATDVGSEGLRLRTAHADYLVDAVDLDFGSGPTEPAIGDYLIDGERRYEVTTLGSGDLPWRWHDTQHIRFRIHTVER